MLRAFEDAEVTHVEDRVDPVADVDIINGCVCRQKVSFENHREKSEGAVCGEETDAWVLHLRVKPRCGCGPLTGTERYINGPLRLVTGAALMIPRL